MKKHYFLNASVAAIAAAIFVFCGCSNMFMQETDLDTDDETATYTVTYMDGNESLFTKIVDENARAENVTLADKDGYTFVGWKLNGTAYNFTTPVTHNITLTADWSDAVYTVYFVADGETIATRTYTKNDTTVEEPAVPEKFGYTREWENYELNGENLTVNAVYTPIEYTVRFFDGDTLLQTLTYTVENKTISEPAVPEKQGKTGEWSEYELAGGDISVYAIYNNVEYTVTFIADGITVGVRTYDIENNTITPPPVPEKEGFSGAWEDFELNFENITVTAVYTPMPAEILPDSNGIYTDTQGLKFKKTENGYSVTGANNGLSEITIPALFNGLPVVAVADYAFTACTDITNISLPDSLKEIGAYAFNGCAFAQLKLPDGLQAIGDYAFCNCKSLMQVEIPDSVETVGVMALGGCIALKTVTVGTGARFIGRLAFTKCSSLTEITFRSPENWILSASATGSGGVPVTLSGNALALINKNSEKYLIKNPAA